MSLQIIDGLPWTAVLAGSEILDRIKSVGDPVPGLDADLLDGTDSSGFSLVGSVLKFGGADFSNSEITQNSGSLALGGINIPANFFSSVALIVYGFVVDHEGSGGGIGEGGSTDVTLQFLINGSTPSGATELRAANDRSTSSDTERGDIEIYTKTSGLGSAWTADFGNVSGPTSTTVTARWMFVIGT